MLGRKVISIAMSIVLVAGLMPLPAFALDLSIGDGITLPGNQTDPIDITTGQDVLGSVERNGKAQYTFTTSSNHSAYTLQITSTSDDKRVEAEVRDSNGSRIAHMKTDATTSESFLLDPDTKYFIDITTPIISSGGANYTFKVTETPSNPQYQPLGTDKNNSYALQLGTPVNSQFTNRSGSDAQWYTLTTTGNHSSYAFKLFSRMDKTVTATIYNEEGNKITSLTTDQTNTSTQLLAANSKYDVKISSDFYNATTGYPSYELTVTEMPSNPQYSALGKDKNNPYGLKLGKTASSQFDSTSGSQKQWFTFKTGSGKLPTYIKVVNKSKSNKVSYTLYEMSGDKVGSRSISGTQTDVYALDKSAQYTIRINGSYQGSSGYTSYQIKVSQIKPGAISTLKTKSRGTFYIEPKWSASKNSNQYRLAYKKSGAKKWSYATTYNKYAWVSNLTKNKKYQFKVQGVEKVNGTSYYGPWSKTVTIKTKAK